MEPGGRTAEARFQPGQNQHSKGYLKLGTILGVWSRLFEAIEQPELGFDLALLCAKNPILARPAIRGRKLALAPNANGNVAAGLVTGRLHMCGQHRTLPARTPYRKLPRG